MSFLVTAPLVLYHDDEGRVCYGYAGQVIDLFRHDEAARFVSMGVVRERDAHKAAVREPDPESGHGHQPAQKSSHSGAQPAKTAPVAEWRAYAAKHGVEGADKLSRRELVARFS